MCGNAKPLSRKAKVLLGGRLDVDLVCVTTQRAGKILLHERDMGCELGGLRDDGGVYVADAVALVCQQSSHVFCQL